MFGTRKRDEDEEKLIAREQALEAEQERLEVERSEAAEVLRQAEEISKAAMRLQAEAERDKAAVLEQRAQMEKDSALVQERLTTIGVIMRRLFTGELDGGDPTENARAMLEYLGTLPGAPAGLTEDLDEKVKLVVRASTLLRMSGGLAQVNTLIEAVRKDLDHKSRYLNGLLTRKREVDNQCKNAAADKVKAEERAKAAEDERDEAERELAKVREQFGLVTEEMNATYKAVATLEEARDKALADLETKKAMLAATQKACEETLKRIKADTAVMEQERDAAEERLRDKEQCSKAYLDEAEAAANERIEAARRAAEEVCAEAAAAITGVAIDLRGSTESCLAMLNGLAGGITTQDAPRRLTEPFAGPPPEPEDLSPSAGDDE